MRTKAYVTIRGSRSPRQVHRDASPTEGSSFLKTLARLLLPLVESGGPLRRGEQGSLDHILDPLEQHLKFMASRL